MEAIELYWVAGVIEGEGCFSIHRKVYKRSNNRVQVYYGCRISITMTDVDIIRRVAKILGGIVNSERLITNRRRGNLRRYSTVIQGPKAIGWMMTLYPIMGDRRKAKIREIINHWKEFKVKPAV